LRGAMNSLSRWIVMILGAGLAGLGLVVIFSEGVSLPTQYPPTRYHFAGASLFLLGAAPLMLGSLALMLEFGILSRADRATYGCIGMGVAMLWLAFLLASKH
jgi:hypothetical protein